MFFSFQWTVTGVHGVTSRPAVRHVVEDYRTELANVMTPSLSTEDWTVPEMTLI